MTLKQIRSIFHQQGMKDPVYRAGYYAKKDSKNPYAFPTDVGNERLALSCKKGLTFEEKLKLQALGEIYEMTEYARWAKGYWRRPMHYKGFSLFNS